MTTEQNEQGTMEPTTPAAAPAAEPEPSLNQQANNLPWAKDLVAKAARLEKRI